MTDIQLPAHLLQRDSRGVAAALAANLSGGSPPYLSIKGNQFTLVDATGNQRMVGAMDPASGLYLDVVIAGANEHTSKIYYEDAFDPSATEYKPPTCFSDNGVAPSAQSQKPQSPTCKACPHNVWGSDVSKMTGKQTKACNDAQKLGIVIPGDEQGIAFLLRVPPASLKHLGKYVREVSAFSAGGRKVDVSDLITRISFEKGVNGILNFAPTQFIDAATMTMVDRAIESKAIRAVVGADDVPYTGPVTAPQSIETTRAQHLPPPPAVPPQQATVEVVGEGAPAPRTRGRPRKAAEKPAEAPAQAPFMPGVEIRQDGNVSFQRGAPAAAPSVETQSSPSFQQPSAQSSPDTHTRQGGIATTASPSDALEIPSFLRRDQQPAQAPPAAQQFGIQEAAPASDEMSQRLAAAFNLSTG